MSERIHKNNTPEAQAHFQSQLKQVQQLMEASNTIYRVVGGGAVHALFNRTLMPFRENGTQVDIDGFIFGPTKEAAVTAQQQLDCLSNQDPTLPDLGFEVATFSETFAKQSPFSLSVLSGLRVWENGQRMSLTYRNLEKEISPETMAAIYRPLNGVEFPIFPARTIRARYVLRGGGVVKSKDRKKLAELDDYIAKHPKEGPPESLYEPYYQFVQEIKQHYPLMIGLFQLFWDLDLKTGGKISGAKSLYKTIGLFNRN